MRKRRLTALALAAILMGAPAYVASAAPTVITDANLGELSIGEKGGSLPGGSEYLINPGGGTLDVAEGVFIDNWFVGGTTTVTLGAGNILKVGTTSSPSDDKDFEIQGSGGTTKFILEQGSKLQVVSDGFGINIGTSYDGGGQATSQLVVKGGNNSGSAVTVEADSFFHVFGKGEFLVEDDSTVNINMTNASGGYFVTGRYDGDLSAFPEADPASFTGGLFKLVGSSQANIIGTAYFGHGGAVDVGLNILNITGDAIFKDGSDYRAARTESAVGKIAVTGEIAIEEGAKVSFFNPISGAPSTVTSITDNNKVILEAGSFYDGTLLQNALFDFRIEDNGSGKRMVVNSYTGSAGAMQSAVSGGLTTNYANTAGLVDGLLTSADTPADLSNRLIGNLEGIDALGESSDHNAEKALKQLVGEEALASVNAAIDTAQQVSSTLGGRFNTLHDAYQAPAAGYADALNRVWLSGFGNWTRQKDRNGIYGYDYDSGGVILGYDREVESVPGLTLGASGAWSSGTVKNNDNLTETDVDVFSLGLYGSYEFGKGLFLDGNINYGFVDNDTSTKLVLGGRKKGGFDSNTLQMGLTLGYTHHLTPATRLIPSVGVQYTHAKQDSWRESIVADPNGTAVAHWFGEVKNDFVEFPVKLRLNSTIEAGNGVLITPELRVGGTFVANKPDAQMQMGFVGSGASTSINGINPGKSRFQVGGGVKIQATDLVDIFANYDFEGRSGFKSHSASAGLGFSF